MRKNTGVSSSPRHKPARALQRRLRRRARSLLPREGYGNRADTAGPSELPRPQHGDYAPSVPVYVRVKSEVSEHEDEKAEDKSRRGGMVGAEASRCRTLLVAAVALVTFGVSGSWAHQCADCRTKAASGVDEVEERAEGGLGVEQSGEGAAREAEGGEVDRTVQGIGRAGEEIMLDCFGGVSTGWARRTWRLSYASEVGLQGDMVSAELN